MIGDARFRMPPVEGDLSGPGEVVEYMASVGNALASAFRGIIEKMNNPQEIMVPSDDGVRPLSDVSREGGWRSGDIKASVGRRSSVLRQLGWVVCNGRNGTPDTYDAIVVGAPEATNAGTEVSGGGDSGVAVPSDTTGPVPADTEAENEVPVSVLAADDGCGGVSTQAADDEHTHPMSSHVHDMSSHVHDISGTVKAFHVIWMMKL